MGVLVRPCHPCPCVRTGDRKEDRVSAHPQLTLRRRDSNHTRYLQLVDCSTMLCGRCHNACDTTQTAFHSVLLYAACSPASGAFSRTPTATQIEQVPTQTRMSEPSPARASTQPDASTPRPAPEVFVLELVAAALAAVAADVLLEVEERLEELPLDAAKLEADEDAPAAALETVTPEAVAGSEKDESEVRGIGV